MSLVTIAWPETSPLGLMFYYDSLNNIAPLSINGFLDGSGYSVPASAANPLPVTLSGGGAITIGNVTMNDPAATTGTITAADVATTTTANSNSQSVITGTPTANSSVSATLSGYSGVTFKLTGTGNTNSTFVFERAVDGGTAFVPMSMELVSVGSTGTSWTTTDNNPLVLRANVGEMTTVRVRCTTKNMTSFAVNIQPGYGISQIIANQGPPNSTANAWPISQAAASIPTATTMQNAAVANGNGTIMTTTGYANALFQIVSSPSMSGGTTVNFEGTQDGSTWVSVSGHQLGVNNIATSTTADGDFRISCSGLQSVRARISGYSAGTVTVMGTVTPLVGTPNSVNVYGISQALPAGSATIGTVGVTSAGYTSAPTVTRPANTTAYTAGDVLGGAITFTTSGPSGGEVLLMDIDLTAAITAVPSGMTTFRLHLYDVTPPSAIADNSPWTNPSGDRASYLGYVDYSAPALLVAGAGQIFTEAQGINKRLKLNASTSLFGYLVTVGGFTPAANSEVYYPRLRLIGV